MEAVTQLSVVLPAFNEESGIESLIGALEEEIVAHHDGVEVIVVDDCSADRTPEILDRLATERPWLRVEHAESNAGHGPSVVRGLELAGGEWIFQIDSDRQFVVRDFGKLWQHRENADLILGVRLERRDPTHRILLSSVVRTVVSLLANKRLHDPNVPFRLFHRSLWEDLRPLVTRATLAPSIFVALGAAVRGWRIVEVPVTHLPRPGGASSLRHLRLVDFSARGLRELVAYRFALAKLKQSASRTTREPS